MLTASNFGEALRSLGFTDEPNGLMAITVNGARMVADFKKKLLIYPEDKGLKINERQTCNFSANENFVVFECVYRLLSKGYAPKHIELEPKWQVGHGSSGGRADVLVKGNDGKVLLLIECKTFGSEFDHEWRVTLQGKGQLFSYAQQVSETQFLCLYASTYEESEVRYQSNIIAHRDNPKYLAENLSLNTFSGATTTDDRFAVWRDTYKLDFRTVGVFEKNIQPYQIGKKSTPLTT